MKIDIDNTFIRYGKMHLTKQKGYGSDTFHSPPYPIGFYAMPIRFQELFLIGSIEKYQPKQVSIPKIIKENSEDYYKMKKEKLKNISHKFTVKNSDFIWHHLNAKPHEIIDRHNEWIKTTVRDWKKSLIKESLTLKNDSLGDNLLTIKNFNEVPPKSGFFSKDHFEVFFDRKVY